MTLNHENFFEQCVNSLMIQVRNCNEDQLQVLFNDEKKINSMVDNLPQVT